MRYVFPLSSSFLLLFEPHPNSPTPGICGSNIYIAREAPHYTTGFATSLAICVCGIVAAFVLRLAYARENKRRDAFMVGKSDEDILAQYTEQELLDLGDRSPFFRYTL